MPLEGVFHNIKVEGIEGVLHIIDITMVQKINEHAQLKLTLMMDRKSLENQMRSSLSDRMIRLTLQGKEVLFHGFIREMETKRTMDLYYLHLTAYSFTYLMDIERKSRSFQNQEMQYEELIQQLLSSYKASSFLIHDKKGEQSLGQFFLQYHETDWEFCKRVVSQINLGLIPEIKKEGLKFYVGLPLVREEAVIKNSSFRVRKNIEKSRDIIYNEKIEDISEADCIEYEVNGIPSFHKLGEKVRFQKGTFAVTEIKTYLNHQEGRLVNDYVLATELGSQQVKRYNHKLTGNSVVGTVIDIKRNYTKLHLNIDGKQDIGTATWFPQPAYFTAGGGKGFSAMPERGDTLNLHFPTVEEKDCYIISSAGAPYEKILGQALSSVQNPKPPEKPVAQDASQGGGGQSGAGGGSGGLSGGGGAAGGVSGGVSMGGLPSAPKYNRNPSPEASDDTMPKKKQWISPAGKSLLLDEMQVKFQSSGGTSQLTLVEGAGILVNSNNSIDISGENIRLNPDLVTPLGTIAGECKKIKWEAFKEAMLICGDSSVIMQGKAGRLQMRANTINLQSPLNPTNITVMSPDEVQALLEEYEQRKLATRPMFLPDGSLITGDNLDDQALFDYYMKYVYEDNGIGTPASSMFITWKQEVYGKNGMERFWDKTFSLDGLQGALDVIGLVFDPADLVNAGIYALRGDMMNAGLSGLSIFPILGTLGAGVKIAGKIDNVGDVLKMVDKATGIVQITDKAGDIIEIRKVANGYEIFKNGARRVLGKNDLLKELGEDLVIKVAGGTAEIISKSKTSHVLTRHAFQKNKEQIPYLLKNMSREKVEKLITDKTFFNKSWSDSKVIDAINNGYNYLLKNGMKEGNNIVEVFGEKITIYIENGKFTSAWGDHLYNLSDFGY